MNRFKVIVLTIVFVLLGITLAQNAQPVQFRFLGWSYEVPELLLVLSVFAVGFLIGFVAAKWPRKKKEEPAPLPRR